MATITANAEKILYRDSLRRSPTSAEVFADHTAHIIVEVDGPIHKGRRSDWRIRRFSNEQIMTRLPDVLSQIRSTI